MVSPADTQVFKVSIGVAQDRFRAYQGGGAVRIGEYPLDHADPVLVKVIVVNLLAINLDNGRILYGRCFLAIFPLPSPLHGERPQGIALPCHPVHLRIRLDGSPCIRIDQAQVIPQIVPVHFALEQLLPGRYVKFVPMHGNGLGREHRERHVADTRYGEDRFLLGNIKEGNAVFERNHQDVSHKTRLVWQGRTAIGDIGAVNDRPFFQIAFEHGNHAILRHGEDSQRARGYCAEMRRLESVIGRVHLVVCESLYPDSAYRGIDKPVRVLYRRINRIRTGKSFPGIGSKRGRHREKTHQYR